MKRVDLFCARLAVSTFICLFLAISIFSMGCQRSKVGTAKNQQTPTADSEDSSAKTEPDSEASSEANSEPHPLESYEEKPDDPIAAAADRYQRRLSADGTIPDRALLNAKAQRDAMLAATQGRMASGGLTWNSQWDWVGPGNIGGRLRPVVFDPNNPDTIYVGSASGGIWKTTNGGGQWFPLDDFLPSLSVSDMIMDPSDSNTLYAATGEGFFEAPEGSSNTAAVRGAGIFVTTNAGASWTQLTSTDNPDFYFVNRLEFDPTDSTILFAATGSGIWRSTDSGTTWSLRHVIDALDIKFNPNDPDQVVAGGHHEHDGPAYSTDGGLTWLMSQGAGGHRQEMAWAPSEPEMVYAAVSDNGRIKIWESSNGGASYTLKTSGNGIQTWASYNNTIWVDPNDKDFMIVGGVYLYRSNDGGTSFARRFNPVHADMHRIVAHPNFDGSTNTTVYFATDGGLWQTNDVYGSSAFDLNNNLGVTQFYGGGINPTTGHIVGGTQDNGTLFYNGDPQNWDHIFGGDGGYGAADPTDPNYFYGEVQRAYLHRTVNGGGNSSYIWNTANPIGDAGSSTTTNFIPFFMLDPNDPNRMLVACERMWRSNNVKANSPDWFSIKDSIAPPPGAPRKGTGGLPGVRGGFKDRQESQQRGKQDSGKDEDKSHFNPNQPHNLSTIAVAEGNSDIIWAAHNNGSLYKTSNGTAGSPTWTRVDENDVGLPDRWISTVVIDREDHDHVYVALMGWEPDNLWETNDGGATWMDASGTGVTGLPDAPISALAVHRNLEGWLFVGTDIGVFASSDNGLTWTVQDGGPGNVPVEQLLWKNDSQLLAVTHGRGMYVATEVTTVPEADKLLTGVRSGGALGDVNSSDDEVYELSPAATTNPNKQLVDLILLSTSPVPSSSNPSTFGFRLQSKMLGGPAGDVYVEVEMYNRDLGQYELIETAEPTNDDSTVFAEPTGDVTRFIHPTTGEVIARLRYRSPGFSGTPFTWTVEIDEAVWMIAE